MKIKLFSLIFFIFFSPFLQAGSDQEAFLRAAVQYKNHNWSGALMYYQAMQVNGPAVWYNKGNCFFYLKQYPDALVCWLRAQKEANSTLITASMRNIAHLNNLVNKPVASSLFDSLSSFIIRKTAAFSLCMIQLLLLGALYALWFVIRRYWMKKSFMSPHILLQFIFFIIGIGSLTTVYGIRYLHQTQSIAVVMQDNAQVFVGPSTNYQHSATLQSMDIVVLKQTINDWYKLSYEKNTGDKVIGWIQKDTITII